MLRFQIGSQCLEVPHADIGKHPGTLLHDMVTQLGQGVIVPPVLLDPAASPLALPGADVLTQAL